METVDPMLQEPLGRTRRGRIELEKRGPGRRLLNRHDQLRRHERGLRDLF